MERILGFAEGAVGVVERMLLVAPDGGELSRPPLASRKRNERGFYVLEVIEPTGELSWVVSDGHDCATCNSIAFAERVKVSLG